MRQVTKISALAIMATSSMLVGLATAQSDPRLVPPPESTPPCRNVCEALDLQLPEAAAAVPGQAERQPLTIAVDAGGTAYVPRTHASRAGLIQRIFELYAWKTHTLDTLVSALEEEGILYTDACPAFPRSKLHTILRDRAYIGEVKYRSQWYPGAHSPLVDRATFDRAQTKMRACVYQNHDLAYGSELLVCAHCGHPITGEVKIKPTRAGPKAYVYYRCSKYNAPAHPRVRVGEAALDAQVLALFDRMRIPDDKVRDWFLTVLRARTRQAQVRDEGRLAELNRQLASLRNQQDRLLNQRLLEEIDEHTFAAKNTQFRDRIGQLNQQVQACDQERTDRAAVAEKAFELSQSLRARWFKADVRGKRRLLEIVCLNFSLDGATLVPTIRKPFDMLAEGLSVSLSRGDRI